VVSAMVDVLGRLRQRPTTGNDNLDVFGAYLVILGCPPLSQSFGYTLMSSSSSLKTPDLLLEFRRYLSQL